jgi:Terpene cyclase DEP1
MTIQLAVFGTLGILTTVWAFVANKRLFIGGTVGPPTVLEVVYYVVGVISLGLGWYFNVRYTHQFGAKASYVDYTKELFTNWASDSAAQDYTIVNLVLLPLWTITDGRRRDVRIPWIFFVMSLFTSLAFSMAFYLAFIERQIRYTRARGAADEVVVSSVA